MTPLQIIFLLVAAISLGGAVMVVTRQNLVHAALWLILVLFGVAVTFVLLNAGFLAMAQVVIYIGAIAILMIFTIMLTRKVAKDTDEQLNSNWWGAGIISLLLFGGVILMLFQWQNFQFNLPNLNPSVDPLLQLGEGLVSPNAFLLPFEIASVLLVAALIGAIMVARERK
ncbi:MAG: NADH-quinone oxidoreductase subunit J [Anaerolineales bacterium]|nr:NADH-quinone oxidoreductase subunit J [Anaerolineales bacterium]